MENSISSSNIPQKIKENMIEFNKNEYEKILEKLAEIHRLKQVQKQKIANTKYVKHEINQDLKKIEKIKMPNQENKQDMTSLKMKLKSLFTQLDEFNKGIDDNNKVLNDDNYRFLGLFFYNTLMIDHNTKTFQKLFKKKKKNVNKS